MAGAIVLPILGGALIGLSATWYWLANGRVAGVSGIIGGALVSKDGRRPALAFLAGLVVAGVVGAGFAVSRGAPAPSKAVLVVAGLLVGVGTRVGGGCTSGHGVCGISRLSRRAVAATLTFIATGALTVFVVAHLLPAWRLP